MKEPRGRGFWNPCHHSCTPHSPPLISTPSPPAPPGERELLCRLPSCLHFVQIGPSWIPGEEHLGAFPGAVHPPPDTTVCVQEACWWGWSSSGWEPFQGGLFSPWVSRPYKCLWKTNMQKDCLQSLINLGSWVFSRDLDSFALGWVLRICRSS